MARSRKSEEGQSTIEFALTLVLLMGFTFFYLQLSLVFAFGSYVHYATFMSSRAYLSASADPEDQEDRARSVIIRMLKLNAANPNTDRFPFMGKGDGGEFPKGFQVKPPGQYKPGVRSSSWMQGVRYTFRSRLIMIPMGRKSGGRAPVNSVTLTSESWLLREPTFIECKAQMGKMLGLFDNGC